MTLRVIARACGRVIQPNRMISLQRNIPLCANRCALKTTSRWFEREFCASSQLPPGTATSGDKFVMVYTCKVCETRAAKTISKHAYYHGVVLVRCPGCENLHLVADRLGWFEDDSTDVESLLQRKGEHVKVISIDNVLELTEADVLGNTKH